MRHSEAESPAPGPPASERESRESGRELFSLSLPRASVHSWLQLQTPSPSAAPIRILQLFPSLPLPSRLPAEAIISSQFYSALLPPWRANIASLGPARTGEHRTGTRVSLSLSWSLSP